MPDLDDINPNALHYLPLGGTGEIGMNFNAYTCRGRWLLVDCGVMFSDDSPNGSAWFADPTAILPFRKRIEALLITHCHQDHLGAVADLWPQLRCPVYTTPFTAALLVELLNERGLGQDVPLHIIPEFTTLELGPFEVERLPLTHSTVEMGAFVVRTRYGSVLHTGDWKFDDAPQVGTHSAVKALKSLAAEDLLAVVGDSTNADAEGHSASESELVKPLQDAIAAAKGRVAVTLFSTNLARVQTIVDAGVRVGRSPILLGRSLERTMRCARSAGYLEDLPRFISSKELGWLPPEGTLMLCTGSQGEPRAALTRLAQNDHIFASLEPGDTVIFSARRIPGNEHKVQVVQDHLKSRGVIVLTPDDGNYHASGHPCRDELRELYGFVKPRYVVPTHGTPSKLEAHAELAESLGAKALRVKNGDILLLGPGEPAIVGQVRTGRVLRIEDQRPPRERRSEGPGGGRGGGRGGRGRGGRGRGGRGGRRPRW